MDERDFKEARRHIMQATLELEAKALNYLLVANGAGLAGCVATLKDYATREDTAKAAPVSAR